MSVGKSVTNGAMLVNTLPGETAFEDNARSFSHCKSINPWRNKLFPVPLVGRMRAVGCRLPVMRKRCDRKLREARMISISKRQYRKENGIQANSHKIWIHNSSVKVTKNNSHITPNYNDYERIPSEPQGRLSLHSRQTAKRTTDTGSCCTVHLHDKWWN